MITNLFLKTMKQKTLPQLQQIFRYCLMATFMGSTTFLPANVWIGSGGTGGNGSWGTGAQWSTGAAPNNITETNQNRLEFYVNGTYTAPSATVSLFSTARRANRIHVGLGKTVTFTLGSSLEIAPDSISIFGSSALGTGSGDSLTTFQATTANANIAMGQFYVGVGGPTILNTLVFDGGVNPDHRLVVTDNSGSSSRVGSTGGNNELRVINGARLQRHGVEVGAGSGWRDNRILVQGAQSELDIIARMGVGTNAYDGGGSAQTIYDSASSNNYVTIEQGGRANVTTLAVGSAAYARSNYVEVEGAGSELILSEGRLTLGASSSLGGNALRISNGGSVGIFSSLTTEIYDYVNNEGFNDGRNRIEIGAGGTLATNQEILNRGLIQLAENARLYGANEDGSEALATVTVAAGGRFEIEGNGLDTSVFTQVQSDGVFAVGLSQNAVGRHVELSSVVEFVDGKLELSWLDAMTFDQVELLEDAALMGNIVLDVFTMDVAIGEEWTLFTGRTDLISAVFDLSGVDPSWDVSRFNEAGGWTLVAVPETGQAIVLVSLLLFSMIAWRRGRGNTSAQ